MTSLRAVVFDFDGTLVDTEWSIFEMAVEAFSVHGVRLKVEQWAGVVGLADESDWWGALCRTEGWDVDRDSWEAAYDAIDRSFRDSLPVEPGVVELLDALDEAGVSAGIASSSHRSWLEGHLSRLGLLERFAVLAGVDRVDGVGKPAPDVYLAACEDLGVDPAGAVAIEDSVHGIASAQAAGLRCVVVPSRITRLTDLSAADLTVVSLTELSLPRLEALLVPENGGRVARP